MKTNKDKMHIYYDEEGDVLEIRLGEPTVSYMKDLGKDIFERIDNKTGKVKGFVILNFKKRSENKVIDIPIPVNLEVIT